MVKRNPTKKQVDEALRESEEKFRSLFEESRDAIYITGRGGKFIDANRAFLDLFGYTKEEPMERNAKDAYISIEDKERFKKTIRERGFLRDYEIKLQRKDGARIDCLLTVTPRLNVRGDIIGYQGIVRDITEHRQMEEALRESENRFRSYTENASDIILVDNQDDGFVRYVSPSVERLLGYKPEELMGTALTIDKIIHPDDRPIAKDANAKSVQQPGIPGPVIELRTLHKDGSWRYFEWVGTSFVEKSGQIYNVANVRDITERKQLEEKLYRISMVDDLTGLYNRRGFFNLSQRQMKIAERTKKHMLLFFADLDNMKHINDTLGHQRGDDALVEMAVVLKETFRESDIIGRIGGDEFTILAIDTTHKSRKALMERLRKSLKAHNRLEARNYTLSLSVGIAHYDPGNPSSLDELMAKADTLMYKEKKRKQT